MGWDKGSEKDLLMYIWCKSETSAGSDTFEVDDGDQESGDLDPRRSDNVGRKLD